MGPSEQTPSAKCCGCADSMVLAVPLGAGSFGSGGRCPDAMHPCRYLANRHVWACIEGLSPQVTPLTRMAATGRRSISCTIVQC